MGLPDYKERTLQEKYIIRGIPLLFIAGFVMHFLFEWTGDNPVVGAFAPVNESVWEHLKLVLLPMILYWTLYYVFNANKYKLDKHKWFTAALVALVTALVLIPLLHYGYTGTFGKESVAVDILILLVAIAAGQLLALHVYKYSKGIDWYIALFVFTALIIFFIAFTFNPPQLPIFMDTPTGTYGI